MYIVIIGLGEVGRHLVRVLEQDRHDIVAVDASADAVRYIEEHHDVATLTGYGASEPTLEQAGVDKADLVVAVTDNDEVNLIAALASKELGAKRTVARTEGNEWARTQQGVRYGLLGVDVVINPSVLVAQELVKIARSHGAVEVIDLAQARIELVQVGLTDKTRFVHKPISSLPLPRDTLIAAIVRGNDLFVPGGVDVLLPGDRIYLLGRPRDIPDAEDLFTFEREARRAWIAGGGVTGESVARSLVEYGVDVAIVEPNLERAQELSGGLDKVTVLHGGVTDNRLLTEEEVGTYDLFAAVTNDDELNLMAALLAERLGVARTAAIVHRPDYSSIYKKLGIDIVVSPRTVASAQILRYCRRTEVKSLTVLQNGQAEVLEIRAEKGCRAIGTPLKQLDLPRGALIGAILHQDDVQIPRGDAAIEEGDTVVILATASARATIERLFRPVML